MVAVLACVGSAMETMGRSLSSRIRLLEDEEEEDDVG